MFRQRKGSKKAQIKINYHTIVLLYHTFTESLVLSGVYLISAHWPVYSKPVSQSHAAVCECVCVRASMQQVH